MSKSSKEYATKYMDVFKKLIIYKNIRNDILIKKLTEYMERKLRDNEIPNDFLSSEIISILIREAEKNSFKGNIFKSYVLRLYFLDENIYSLYCEKGKMNVNNSLYDLFLNEVNVLKEILDMDLSLLLDQSDIDSLLGNYIPIQKSNKDYNNLNEYINKVSGDILNIGNYLTEYYNQYGCGKLSLYTMFKLDKKAHLIPVINNDKVVVDDLIGNHTQKEALIKNTEAFIKGYPANNALLIGARGTGKSSLVKAISNMFYKEGLRLVEINKNQLDKLSDTLNLLKNRGKRFVLYLDDLSFDDFEIQYKYLKSLLEGSVEEKPENVLFYATSNRRHIISEKWEDKDGIKIIDGEVHSSDTVNEKLSLSDRFGLTISFSKPSPKDYMEIVKGIAEREGLLLDEEKLEKDAMKWELNQSGLSGRTARQYINNLLCDIRDHII